MHITIISQCEKKALKRTRTIVDQYAVRISERTWVTPITIEALNDLKKALSMGASRSTAVACYVNKGMQSMRLAWTVGNSSMFGLNGAYPVSTKKRTMPAPPPWARTLSLVARAAGLAHDLGKGSVHFQNKLKAAVDSPDSKPIKDETRHEWVSFKLYQEMRKSNDFSWEKSWGKLKIDKNIRELPFNFIENHISSAFDAVDFAILTHHDLFAPNKEPVSQGSCPSKPKETNHTKRERGLGEEEIFSPAGLDPELSSVMSALAKTTERLDVINQDRNGKTDIGATQKKDIDQNQISYWRAIAIMSRAALILADHEVSAKDETQKNSNSKRKNDQESLWANTRAPSFQSQVKMQKKTYNQKLPWHLQNVSIRAQEISQIFRDSMLPGLSLQTREFILSPSSNPNFYWQNEAVDYLKGSRLKDSRPTLIFNLASTGSGKTRANVKIAAALKEDNEPLRIAAGFNLRTLTTQTHRAFQSQLGMSDDEVACVIGDYFAKAMSEEISLDTDENLDINPSNGPTVDLERTGEIVYETSDVSSADYPDWLVNMSKSDPNSINLIGVPVLVSTMDYLVNAGDPSKQGQHGKALIRIASSDLILDEVDSYDPESLVSVLRVVQMAGMFGRNVIASSATLCEPIAHALYETYCSGVTMFYALRDKNTDSSSGAQICFIDNQVNPELFLDNGIDSFKESYKKRINSLVVKTQEKPALRINEFQEIQDFYIKGNNEFKIKSKSNPSSGSFDIFSSAIKKAILKMHGYNSWVYNPSDKRVSFGLVRVASVKNCVALTRELNKISNFHVTAYHSADLRLRRSIKEEALDHLFSRKPDDGFNGNRAILRDKDIANRVKETNADDVIFIVVATPVEEVGRDHDFDWAVIEPSSVQSIVQVAGRVNRHRLMNIKQPNISILQFNYLELNNRVMNKEDRVFHGPGNEMGDTMYDTHDAINLLNFTSNNIDSALRFGDGKTKCSFSIQDDESIEERLNRPKQVLLANKKFPLAWVSKCHYQRYPLRSKNIKSHFRIAMDGDETKVLEKNFKINKGKMQERWDEVIESPGGRIYIKKNKPEKDYWLAPGIKELVDISSQFDKKLLQEKATEFDVYDTNKTIEFDQWLGGY